MRIYRFHKSLSKAKLFITAFGVLYFLTTLISVIGNFIQENAYQIDALEGKSLILVFFLLVVVAPVVETFIFQYGIIELCLLVRSKYNKQIALFVSALLFGLSHSYNIIYIVFATIMGAALAFYYLCFRKYENKICDIGYHDITCSVKWYYFFIKLCVGNRNITLVPV